MGSEMCIRDRGTEGRHHARIVRFLREHDVVACVATHAGMGMQRTLAAMKVPLLPATLPRARESVEHAMISAYADTKGTEES